MIHCGFVKVTVELMSRLKKFFGLPLIVIVFQILPDSIYRNNVTHNKNL